MARAAGRGPRRRDRAGELDGLPDLLATEPAGALRHERVPFLSYPYEWPFAMLKDAALLQLELNRRALART